MEVFGGSHLAQALSDLPYRPVFTASCPEAMIAYYLTVLIVRIFRDGTKKTSATQETHCDNVCKELMANIHAYKPNFRGGAVTRSDKRLGGQCYQPTIHQEGHMTPVLKNLVTLPLTGAEKGMSQGVVAYMVGISCFVLSPDLFCRAITQCKYPLPLLLANGENITVGQVWTPTSMKDAYCKDPSGVETEVLVAYASRNPDNWGSRWAAKVIGGGAVLLVGLLGGSGAVLSIWSCHTYAGGAVDPMSAVMADKTFPILYNAYYGILWTMVYAAICGVV